VFPFPDAVFDVGDGEADTLVVFVKVVAGEVELVLTSDAPQPVFWVPLTKYLKENSDKVFLKKKVHYLLNRVPGVLVMQLSLTLNVIVLVFSSTD
jgi:hypothetical protein